MCYEKRLKNVGRLRWEKGLFVFTHDQGRFNVCVGLASHLRSVYNVAADVKHFTGSYIAIRVGHCSRADLVLGRADRKEKSAGH